MKNIQVIDSADNAEYAIYEVTNNAFDLIFPEPGQNVEFSDDFFSRVGFEAANAALKPAWRRKLKKSEACGIHGTLFYGLEKKKAFYPNKRDSDIIDHQYDNL